jgi:hypothetical protein
MGIARQTYYKRKRAYETRLQRNQTALDLVLEKRRSQPRLRARKLHHLLHIEVEGSLHVGQDHLVSILRETRELVSRKRVHHKTRHVPASSQPA